MSQVVVNGEIKRISHADLVAIDALAAEKGWSRERAAESFYAPKKAARKAAKKRAKK